jgi:hypothetical protein
MPLDEIGEIRIAKPNRSARSKSYEWQTFWLAHQALYAADAAS